MLLLSTKPAPTRAHKGRLFLTLIFLMLTSMTAWAGDVTVTSSTTSWTNGNTYNVTSNVTIGDRITVEGTVVLNLSSGCTLTANNGIDVSSDNNAHLTINGPGSLYVNVNSNNDYHAGIGATKVGTIIINGGTITASGNSMSAGIGGNPNNTDGGTITINGGQVTANGGYGAAGIGGGIRQSTGGICGNITINGGQVTANGGYDAPGIGGGSGASNSGTVTLGWTNSDDFIQASYNRISTLQFATGKQFYLDGTKTVATTGNISGKKIKPLTDAVKKNLDLATISNLASSYFHTGSAINLGYTVNAIDGTPLTKDTDFTQGLTCNGNATSEVNNVGAYTLTLTGTGDYTGSTSANFDVLASLSGAGTEASPYIINSTEDWTTFSAEAFAATYWANGVYVKLSDTWDNTSDAVTTTVGTSSHPFQGHFLGNGKTLNVGLSATTDNCAPFGYIEGATIQDLTIAGSITTTKKYAASIAAHTSDTTNISNCQSIATITSTATSSGDCTHGGFVAVNEGSATLYFTNCIFKGKMLGSNATSNGGFVGYNSGTKIYYTDCFFAPTELTMSASSSSTFNRNGKNELTRCYYTEAFGTAEGTQVFTTPQSGFCKRLTLDGSDYYATGTAVITTTTHYDYTGSAITVTPAMTYDGTALDADCYTATITKDGNAVTTVADKGRYSLTIIGNTSKGYYGGKSINFYVMADLSGSGTQETPYLIDDAADWEKFAANINGGTNADKYYKLTADIVGIESMAGTSTNKFSGTFDGNGKTLTLSLTTVGSENTAPFRYVDGATISRLTTAGYVNGGNQKNATGLIGNSVGTVNITACRSSVAINSSVSGDGTHGGFIGVASGTVTFTNCLFDGSITGNNTINCGGFVGWRNGTLTFNNCLMAGTMTLSTTSGSATFNRNGSSTLNTCYYRNDYGGSQGTAVGSMTNAELAAALGSSWEVIGSDVLPIMGDKDLATATISGVSATYNYNGTPIEITYTVTAFGGATLTKGTHYTATIDGNDVTTVSTAGIHTLTITAKDGSGYTGSQSVSFRVFAPIAYQQYDTTNETLTNQTVSAGSYSLVAATTTSMDTGWYVVNENVTVGSQIWVSGDVNLVLCDGVTLTASRGIVVRSGKSLTIYSQSGNTGVLTAHAYGMNSSAIGEGDQNAGTITVHGGEINATCHGDASKAIGGNNGTVNIYGGRISASYDQNGKGIGGSGATVNLGWCRATDNIYAKSFGGTVNLLGNFVFDTNRQQVVTTGNINSNRRIVPQGDEWFVMFNSQGGSAVAQQSVDDNATATEPTAPTRTGYTFGGWYTDTDCTDGNDYNFSAAVTANLTLYAKWTLTDFAITLPESFQASVGGNTATTATMGQTVTLTIKSGYTLTGSITATDANSQTVALTNLGNDTYTFTMPALSVNVVAFAGIIEPGWTLVGTYKTQNFDANDTYYYGFVGTTGTGTELGTFVQVGGYVRVKPLRAYLVAPGGTPKAAAPARRTSNEQNPTTLRVRLLNSDGETTSLNEELRMKNEEFATATGWYTLDGRKLSGEPTQKGLYIHHGRKVVIK